MLRRLNYLLKKIINIMLAKLGYKIISVNTEDNFSTLIKQTELLFRENNIFNLDHNNRRPSLLMKMQGTNIYQGLNIIGYLNRCLPIEGDVCEFGVAQGATSALIANEIMDTAKNLWLFDTFEGLPQPSPKDVLIDDIYNLGNIQKYEGRMFESADNVISRMKNISFGMDKVKIIKGIFDDDLLKRVNLPEKICFAYIDFDFYDGTINALEFLNSRLVDQGVILIDDYKYFSSGVETAVTEFLNKYKGRYRFDLPEKDCWGHFCILTKVSSTNNN